MSDELLHALGDYFVRWRIGQAFGLTFEQFLQEVDSGLWREAVIFSMENYIKQQIF